jgi:type 1 glutamine amidotransferase
MLLSLLCALCLSLFSAVVQAQELEQQDSSQIVEAPDSILVFSKTAGFRHDSIPEGVTCFRELAAELGFQCIATEDSSIFNPTSLASVAVVVFLNTTGDVLTKPQEAAFEAYIKGGGAWLGVHAAADTEYDWPFYGQLVGAYFKSHPAIQPANIDVEVRDHPSTRMLPGIWRRTDEWYTYRLSPRKGVTVLASLDESSFTGGGMAGDHPIAWCHEFEGGRALYTGGGHTGASFREEEFRGHLKGSLAWLIEKQPEEVLPETAAPSVEESSPPVPAASD